VITGSIVFTMAFDQSRIWSMSASGMPSISEITWNGRGKARSAIRSVRPGRLDPVEHLVDELLDAGAQPFDGPRGERLGHQPAQAVVVGRVETEHRTLLAHQVAVADDVGHLLGAGAVADVAVVDAERGSRRILNTSS
jgi:hypothetical protein